MDLSYKCCHFGLFCQPHLSAPENTAISVFCKEDTEWIDEVQECASGGRGPATRFASQRRPVIDSAKERSSEYIGRHSSGASIISEHSAQLLDLNKEQPGEEAGQPIL